MEKKDKVNRKNFSSGAVWENLVGYSRAVRVGNIIEIAGTAPVKDGKVVGKGNPYKQTKYVLEVIENVLKQAGASLKDVIRTRIYVTDISKWEEVGKAHGEFFKKIKPVTTMVEVKALINPEFLVEMEATAITGSSA